MTLCCGNAECEHRLQAIWLAKKFIVYSKFRVNKPITRFVVLLCMNSAPADPT